MSRLPARLEIAEVQQALREVWAVLDPFLTQNLELKGRRVTGAGHSINPQDYVNRYELERGYSFDKFREMMKKEGLEWNRQTIINPLIETNGKIIYDKFSNRPNPTQHKKEIFVSYGELVKIGQNGIAWISVDTGVTGWQWIYQSGVSYGAIGDNPWKSGITWLLGTYDLGLIHWSTTYNHIHIWDGSAFEWGPGDEGAGHVVMRSTSTTHVGWTACAGAAIAVSKETADGTDSITDVPTASNGFLLVSGSAYDQAKQTEEAAKFWDVTSADTHRTDDEPQTGSPAKRHKHLISANSLDMGGPSATAAVDRSDGDMNGPTGAHIHTGPDDNVLTDEAAAHSHPLSDTYAKLKWEHATNHSMYPRHVHFMLYMRQ